MGLETGNRIEDLNPSWPNSSPDEVSQGYDHLRLIKTCLQGSFPSLGGGQCNATAEELGDVANKLVSFNGRTDTAAVPVAGDYDVNDIARITVGTINEGDVLVGNASNEFEAVSSADAILPPIQYLRYAGTSQRPSARDYGIYFDSEQENTITSAFGTVTNTTALGFSFEANDDVMVTIESGTEWSGGPDVGFTVDADTSVSINSASNTQILARCTRWDYSVGCSVKMAAGEVLRIHTDGNGGNNTNQHVLTMAVQRIAV